MSNRWGIPFETEVIVKNRDQRCVYCGREFSDNGSRKFKPSWEHIINDIRINGPDNIALCCCSCNASKGTKKLEDWLKGKYCCTNNISINTVAKVVKEYLTRKLNEQIKACP